LTLDIFALTDSHTLIYFVYWMNLALFAIVEVLHVVITISDPGTHRRNHSYTLLVRVLDKVNRNYWRK